MGDSSHQLQENLFLLENMNGDICANSIAGVATEILFLMVSLEAMANQTVFRPGLR